MIRKILVKLRTVKERNTRLRLMFLVIAGAVIVLTVMVGFAGFFVYLPYDQLVNGPKAAETLKDLEIEFKKIPPLPGAVERRCGSMHKTHQGDVTCEYNTGQNYEEIRAHYSLELESHGWTFIKERPVTIWWHDYGGKEVLYCKGHYTAILQYAGQEEPAVGWTFGFGMSWGLFDECR